ncbi:MAG: hypothetical protein KAH30_02170 [Caldisericia bacterium]|nr:hypothetical protein [Caldisericia bacterium]
MQIILNDEEIDLIFEALITEKREALIDIANDDRRGRDLSYRKKYLKQIEDLSSRFLPYTDRS